MFDIGFWELAVLGVIALVILGPERLPGAAHTLGLWIGKGRRMLRDVKADIDRELREHNAADLAALKKEVESAGQTFKDSAEKVGAEVKAGADVGESVKEAFASAAPGAATPPLDKGGPGGISAASDDGNTDAPAADTATQTHAADAPDKSPQPPLSRGG